MPVNIDIIFAFNSLESLNKGLGRILFSNQNPAYKIFVILLDLVNGQSVFPKFPICSNKISDFFQSKSPNFLPHKQQIQKKLSLCTNRPFSCIKTWHIYTIF